MGPLPNGAREEEPLRASLPQAQTATHQPRGTRPSPPASPLLRPFPGPSCLPCPTRRSSDRRREQESTKPRPSSARGEEGWQPSGPTRRVWGGAGVTYSAGQVQWVKKRVLVTRSRRAQGEVGRVNTPGRRQQQSTWRRAHTVLSQGTQKPHRSHATQGQPLGKAAPPPFSPPPGHGPSLKRSLPASPPSRATDLPLVLRCFQEEGVDQGNGISLDLLVRAVEHEIRQRWWLDEKLPHSLWGPSPPLLPGSTRAQEPPGPPPTVSSVSLLLCKEGPWISGRAQVLALPQALDSHGQPEKSRQGGQTKVTAAPCRPLGHAHELGPREGPAWGPAGTLTPASGR